MQAPQPTLQKPMTEENQATSQIQFVPVAELTQFTEGVSLSGADVDLMAEMIVQHGWQDPLRIDVVESGVGAPEEYLRFGNGRIMALQQLQKNHNKFPELFPMPAGVATSQDGQWMVPVERVPVRIEVQGEAQEGE